MSVVAGTVPGKNIQHQSRNSGAAAWASATNIAAGAVGHSTAAGQAALSKVIASLKAAVQDPGKLAVMAQAFERGGDKSGILLKQLKGEVGKLKTSDFVIRPPGGNDSLTSPGSGQNWPAVLLDSATTGGKPVIMYNSNLSPQDLLLATYTEVGNYISDALNRSHVNVASGAVGARFAILADHKNAFSRSLLNDAAFKKDFVRGNNQHSDKIQVVFNGRTVTGLDLSGWAIFGIVVGSVVAAVAVAALAVVLAPIAAAALGVEAAGAAAAGAATAEIEMTAAGVAIAEATEATETAAAAGETIAQAEAAGEAAAHAAAVANHASGAVLQATEGGATAGMQAVEALTGDLQFGTEIAESEAGNVAAEERVAADVSRLDQHFNNLERAGDAAELHPTTAAQRLFDQAAMQTRTGVTEALEQLDVEAEGEMTALDDVPLANALRADEVATQADENAALADERSSIDSEFEGSSVFGSDWSDFSTEEAPMNNLLNYSRTAEGDAQASSSQASDAANLGIRYLAQPRTGALPAVLQGRIFDTTKLLLDRELGLNNASNKLTGYYNTANLTLNALVASHKQNLSAGTVVVRHQMQMGYLTGKRGLDEATQQISGELQRYGETFIEQSLNTWGPKLEGPAKITPQQVINGLVEDMRTFDALWKNALHAEGLAYQTSSAALTLFGHPINRLGVNMEIYDPVTKIRHAFAIPVSPDSGVSAILSSLNPAQITSILNGISGIAKTKVLSVPGMLTAGFVFGSGTSPAPNPT